MSKRSGVHSFLVSDLCDRGPRSGGTRRLARGGAALGAIALAGVAAAQPDLPDFGAAEFGPDSSISDHPLFPLEAGTLFLYKGDTDEGAERIHTFVSNQTKSILGVETRVVIDTHYVDDVLVEVARDWYAQSKDGTVWYMGEAVNNYNYDDQGNLIDITHDGSWIADGVTNFAGATMLADPKVGDQYYQEYAPGIALDFALVRSVDATVEVPFGHFEGVLDTAEGNQVDGPMLPDAKLYAPGVGLVLHEVLDDQGNTLFETPLVSKSLVPGPGTPVVLGGIGLVFANRRRGATV